MFGTENRRGRLTITSKSGRTLLVTSPSEEFERPGTGPYTPQRDHGINLARENDALFVEVNLDHIQTIRKKK